MFLCPSEYDELMENKWCRYFFSEIGIGAE